MSSAQIATTHHQFDIHYLQRFFRVDIVQNTVFCTFTMFVLFSRQHTFIFMFILRIILIESVT